MTFSRQSERHDCPAIGCTNGTKGILCRRHEAMVTKADRARLRELRRLVREDPFVWEAPYNEAWRQVLTMMAAKDSLRVVLVSSARV